MEVEGIYFLTGFSRWVAPISLVGPRGGDITIEDLIVQYCIRGTQMSVKKIPIKDVMDIPLRTILFTMQRVFGSQKSHQASRAHILFRIYGSYSVQLVRGNIIGSKGPTHKVSKR